MQKDQARVFFPGLNGLRFLAASAVIITHVELLKQQVGLDSLWDEKKHPILFNLGGLGVYFFFVLSGFLITYLLLVEKEKAGNISIRDFYLRRIFRIWPVYYLLVFLAFFVFPHIPLIELKYFQRFFYDHFWIKFLMFMFLLPNLALGFFRSIPHAGQAWSIGVEEQFYIIWPWIVRKSKNLVRTIIIFGIIIVAIKITVLLANSKMPGNKMMQGLKEFVAMLKMECMAIGGLGACVVFQKKNKILDWAFHPITQLFSILLVPALIFFMPDKLQDGEHIIYSLLFLIIILNVALNPKSFIKLENRVFNFLGNISYGMYMYHMFLIVLVLKTAPNLVSQSYLNVYYYAASFVLAILFSALSYYLYERIFIRMKSRFSKVISGSDSFNKTA
jgi:peptidoglycan/LPS O-acetylase OafA/YrhL